MTAWPDLRTPWTVRFLLGLLLLEPSQLEVSGVESTPQGEGPQSKPSTQWRIINLDPVAYGWAVSELRIYKDTKCSKDLTTPKRVNPNAAKGDEVELTWRAISSGDNNAPASRAFDRLTWTEWRASCYMCAEGEAWIGLQFNMPVSVYCMSLFQWGKREYLTSKVMLQRWEAGPAGSGTGEWRDVLKGSGLGGERWDKIQFTQCNEIAAPDHGRVVVTNGGYYPSHATFSCSGARLMRGADQQDCLADGVWPEDTPVCWPLISIVILVSGTFTIELICFGLYYFLVVWNKPPPLQNTTFIPDDSMGSFTTHEIHGINQEEEDDGSTTRSKRVFLYVVCCFCCRVADTWHSVGQVPYFVGVWIPQTFPLCLPCFAAFIRGQIRQRFQIKGAMFRDFWLWLCCIPCVATQEAKHVDHMCDVAEEEAVVMKKAQERKEEKERKIREQIAEKQAHAGHGMADHLHGNKRQDAHPDKVGKGHEHHEDKKGHHKKEKDEQQHMHPDFLRPKSVMDILSAL